MRRAGIIPPGTLWPPTELGAGLVRGDDPRRLSPTIPGDRGRPVRTGFARHDGVVPSPGVPHQDRGPLPGGRQRPSKRGGADGGIVGTIGGRQSDRGPRFDQTVSAGGYAWWYVDALSDDGRHGLTVIAFIGSVFSPYYARARQLGQPEAIDFCSLNVALYGASGKHWAMTERGRAQVDRARDFLTIGQSRLSWDGNALTIDINEHSSPIARPLRGRVRLSPHCLVDYRVAIDADAQHNWQPIAPAARVEVAFDDPALRWAGPGYLDSNSGSAPIEDAFTGWTWSRAHVHDGMTVLYDMTRRDQTTQSLALHFDDQGRVTHFDPPPPAPLPRSLWRVDRTTRADADHSPRILQTLEDTPFYARSVLSTHLLGQPAVAMHESLSLDRFRTGWVQWMLPYRMPRDERGA